MVQDFPRFFITGFLKTDTEADIEVAVAGDAGDALSRTHTRPDFEQGTTLGPFQKKTNKPNKKSVEPIKKSKRALKGDSKDEKS